MRTYARTMTAATATPSLEAATTLAEELLRPAAERVDQQGVPRSHLDALAAAGLLAVTAPVDVGGCGQPAAIGREVAEVLAGACGATWFVWTQHALPLATLLRSDNLTLRSRLLPAMTTGPVLAGVAVAHLRRPGPPAVTAVRSGQGWRFDGQVDWMTSWGLCDVLLLGAVTDDGRLVLAFVDAREQPGLRAGAPMRLAAMQATHTVALELTGLLVADADIAEVTDAGSWLATDQLKTANPSPHTFGLQAEVVRRLREVARRRHDADAAALADALGSEGSRLRARAYALIDEVPAADRIDERLQVRAASLELVVRSAAALVTASGGGAMALGAAPQRLAREAMFHLVQAQTGPVRAATLQLLAERSG